MTATLAVIIALLSVLQAVSLWILGDLRDRIARIEDKYIERRGFR